MLKSETSAVRMVWSIMFRFFYLRNSVSGNDLPRAANFDAVVRVGADLPNAIFNFNTRLLAELIHEGGHYEDPLNLIERDSVTTMNLAATMNNPELGLTLRFYVNNVTDEESPRQLGSGNFLTDNADITLRPSITRGWQVLPRRPREYGLTAIYRFE